MVYDGYFSGRSLRQHSDLASCSGFSILYFPWLPLDTTDIHVLESTARNLGGKDGEIRQISTSCALLREVIFHDFPAEVFLQRPDVIQVMLPVDKWFFCFMKEDFFSSL